MNFETRTKGGGNFLKVEPGKSVRGIFQGDIHRFKYHWSQKTVCPGFDKCSVCAKITDEMSDEEKKKLWPAFRFRINFVTNENGVFSAHIWEQGGTTYDALKALHEEHDLTKTPVKITRFGSGPKDTTYQIVPSAGGPMPKEMLEQVKQVKLLELEHSKQSAPVPPSSEEDEASAFF